MTWAEFSTLLSGLMPDTPLGNMVSIRSEDDKEVLKEFNQEQHRIRREWRNRNAKKVDMEEYNNALKNIQNMFKSLS